MLDHYYHGFSLHIFIWTLRLLRVKSAALICFSVLRGSPDFLVILYSYKDIFTLAAHSELLWGKT